MLQGLRGELVLLNNLSLKAKKKKHVRAQIFYFLRKETIYIFVWRDNLFLIPEKKKLAHSSLYKSHMWASLSILLLPLRPLSLQSPLLAPPHHLKVGGPRAQASDLFSTYIHFLNNLIQFHGLKLYLYTHDSQCYISSPSGTSHSYTKSKHLFNFSIQMSNRHLKVNSSKSELLFLQSSPFQYVLIPSFWLLKPKGPYSYTDSILPQPITNPSANPVGSTSSYRF